VRLAEFERLARSEFEAIPEKFREGVEGPLVERKAKAHPYLDSYYTLGECVQAPGVSHLQSLSLEESPEPLSLVVLYYGSFTALAREDPGFEIPAEVRETVRHEVRHHLEDRAGSALLRNEDEAEEQDERRRQGLPHAPGYWRLGERLGRGLWRVHADLFLELDLGPRGLERARRRGLRLRWRGRTLRAPPGEPAEGGGLLTFEGEGEEHEGMVGDLVVAVSPR